MSPTPVRTCRDCGCTDARGCPPDMWGRSCWWHAPDLCSRCAGVSVPPGKDWYDAALTGFYRAFPELAPPPPDTPPAAAGDPLH